MPIIGIYTLSLLETFGHESFVTLLVSVEPTSWLSGVYRAPELYEEEYRKLSMNHAARVLTSVHFSDSVFYTLIPITNQSPANVCIFG